MNHGPYRDDERMTRRLARKQARQNKRNELAQAQLAKRQVRKGKLKFYGFALIGGAIGNMLYHLIAGIVRFAMS